MIMNLIKLINVQNIVFRKQKPKHKILFAKYYTIDLFNACVSDI